MVKKEVFEWIINKQKNFELRQGKAKKGDVAVFQCGRNILRRKIIKKEWERSDRQNFLDKTVKYWKEDR